MDMMFDVQMSSYLKCLLHMLHHITNEYQTNIKTPPRSCEDDN